MGVAPEDAGGSQIQVQVSGLTDLAREVSAENNGTLRRSSAQVRKEFVEGVPFGATSASGYVYAAKQRYQESLQQSIKTLNEYVLAADVLVAAATTVAANYRKADALSAARSDEVTAAFAQALAAARAAQARSAGGGSRAAL